MTRNECSRIILSEQQKNVRNFNRGGNNMKTRKITKSKFNRKRICLFGIIIFLLVICFIIMLGGKTSSHVETTYRTVHVSAGETLWEISRIEHANNGYYEEYDIREIVRDIKQINNLNSSNLYEGQELIIPSR